MFVTTKVKEAVAELFDLGLSQPEIARQLGIAPTTVSYHVEGMLGAAEDEPGSTVVPPRERLKTRDSVARLLTSGLSHTAIARTLGISKQTVTYHAHRLSRNVDQRFAAQYDWDAVQQHYDLGHSVRDCMRAFGFSSGGWTDAVRRGAIVPRPNATPLPDLLVAGTYRGRDNLKLRLLKEGVKDSRCERCGLSAWRGLPLSMALHHINGDRLDNRLENLGG